MSWVHFSNFVKQKDRGTTENTVIIGTVVLLAVIVLEITRQPVLTPVILTKEGPVQGVLKVSREGKPFWSFLGIPYGEPPVGSQKFLAPLPKKPWSNVKKVTSFPPKCAQLDVINGVRVTGQLDCLFLNVFVSVAEGQWKQPSKPVLVYLHGGGFASCGTSNLHPDLMMDQDIVLVIVGYRLGPIGFLNLQNTSNPGGNAGLLDQHLALQWVQRNIARFGGDSKKVLLFGESAGATSTHLHVMSPLSRGLFQKALLQSGTAMPTWAFSGLPRIIAENYARKVGCPTTDDSFILNCFETMDWEDLVGHQTSIHIPLDEKDLFGPSLDGKFLTKSPYAILRDRNYPPIPIMIGVNENEGNVRSARFEAMPELIEKLNDDWNNQLANLLSFEKRISPEHTQILKRKYFPAKKLQNDPQGFRRNLTKFVSEGGFYYPLHTTALEHANAGAQTYLYYYNYTSNILPTGYRVIILKPWTWLPHELNIIFNLLVDGINHYIFGNDILYGSLTLLLTIIYNRQILKLSMRFHRCWSWRRCLANVELGWRDKLVCSP